MKRFQSLLDKLKNASRSRSKQGCRSHWKVDMMRVFMVNTDISFVFFSFSHNLFIVLIAWHVSCSNTPSPKLWGENRLKQRSSRHVHCQKSHFCYATVRRTRANWDVAPLPLQPSLPITMATPFRQQSKMVVGGKCKSIVHLSPPTLLLLSLHHSLFLFLPDAPFIFSLPQMPSQPSWISPNHHGWWFM